jgi:hypothetical protein
MSSYWSENLQQYRSSEPAIQLHYPTTSLAVTGVDEFGVVQWLDGD